MEGGWCPENLAASTLATGFSAATQLQELQSIQGGPGSDVQAQ